MEIENNLSHLIIGAAMEVHKHLGPGLLKSAYQTCLAYELNERGIYVIKEKPMPVIYKGIKLNHGYRIDLLVENKVVVEIKTVEAINGVHIAQVLTYLKLGDYKLGLILNFHTLSLKNGIKRVINFKLDFLGYFVGEFAKPMSTKVPQSITQKVPSKVILQNLTREGISQEGY